MANLIIPVGIPGCGKTALAETLFDLKYSPVSTDDIRIEMFGSLRASHDVAPEVKREYNAKVFAEFHRRILDQLKHGVDTIADATNLHRYARTKLRDLAEEATCLSHIILFKNPHEAMMRNRRRPHDQVVPESEMLNMLAQYYEALRDIAQEPYASITEIASVR